MNKTPTFRFDIVENGVCIGQAFALNKPSVKCDSDAEVKMSLLGEFVLNIQDPNWLKARIKPYLIIGGKESSLGEYLISQADDCTDKKGVKFWQIKGMDLGRIPQRSRTEKRVLFQAGQRYTDIVQSILLELGVSRIIAIQSDATLKNDRADWEIGTSWIKIINSLLAEINYQSLWFDTEGNARIQPHRQVDGTVIDHRYESGELSQIKPQVDISSDIYKAYNVFTAMVSSPEYEEPMIAVSVNDIPTSRISTVNIGRVQAPIEKLDDIANQEELQKYVDNLRFQSMCSTETISFRTALNQHQVRDIVSIHHPQASGIYQETQWKMTLSFDGEMTHTAQRVVIE
ncbi:hypothetical protein [Negativibacillus massiliensis]|uniref:hypothetical protein n=1 Tax=Negativibacillus massiliensis TaxID=1871035 RepID=UPI003AF210D7